MAFSVCRADAVTGRALRLQLIRLAAPKAAPMPMRSGPFENDDFIQDSAEFFSEAQEEAGDGLLLFDQCGYFSTGKSCTAFVWVY